MFVFVINKHGKALMPCSQRKARILLKTKKAKIIKYQPFTIQLLYGSYGYKQKVKVGIHLGARRLGIAIQSNNHVLAKGEIELRDDIKNNLESRKVYRRNRRNRKCRYRKARFLNRISSKREGWLPPSIRSRSENMFHWIDRFCSLIPDPTLIIQIGKFDFQKIINSHHQNQGDQKDELCSYYNTRYFVFTRDHYTCQVCRKKNKILNTHHIIYRSHGGSNCASNLISVCTDCHTNENHQKGQILWRWMMDKKSPLIYKESPFIHTLRKQIFLKYPNAEFTYGSMTVLKRKRLGLEKSYMNDVLALSDIRKYDEDRSGVFKIKQFRKKKRSLHEATARKGRKAKNITSKRNEKNTKQLKGFFLNDKVRLYNKLGYITGFTGKNSAYIKTIDNEYITMPNKSYKQVSLSHLERICHNNNWQFAHLPYVNDGRSSINNM
ncbi:RNA-guided endonuclease IscB [Metabacillus fastidiosus]|uniref:RNA-guided endonuclease IscB n=1 Tax=Metabacillus fastidiosus TaxID=1458 RepID=A0ABU6NUL0_9BACI|nr:RNA-guided endonuclease IscB [Metabacillus fastidiosus]